MGDVRLESTMSHAKSDMTKCRVRRDVMCDLTTCAIDVDWEFNVSYGLAFGWHEVMCDLTCKRRSCATLKRQGHLQP